MLAIAYRISHRLNDFSELGFAYRSQVIDCIMSINVLYFVLGAFYSLSTEYITLWACYVPRVFQRT
jgi:hypothetical protein